uniref:Remodeling and spacing factor 1 n=1 Tax=Ursus americanus TaxID=9643 RepID=A0A452RA27_URSAM
MAAAAAAAAAAMAPPGCPGSCPNFAVVCSFLERYGPLLDLPELPFPELERVLQAPPPDVGSGEGKRGARTPGGKRPWHAPSLLARVSLPFPSRADLTPKTPFSE